MSRRAPRRRTTRREARRSICILTTLSSTQDTVGIGMLTVSAGHLEIYANKIVWYFGPVSSHFAAMLSVDQDHGYHRYVISTDLRSFAPCVSYTAYD